MAYTQKAAQFLGRFFYLHSTPTILPILAFVFYFALNTSKLSNFKHSPLNMEPDKAALQKLYDESLISYTNPAERPEADHYLITAWNPMSLEVSMDENNAANKELERDLIALTGGAAEMGYCYGYHPDESWREDGFWVSSKVVSLQQIMELARKYRQIAIYKQTETARPVLWVDYEV